MTIDIDQLSEEELIDLNNRVVARLRFLNQMRAHSQMLDFRIGDRVTFHPKGAPAAVWYRHSLQQENSHGDHQRWTALARGAGPFTQGSVN